MGRFDRHQKIALQFSGGKDSIATLELMRPHWDRLTVYWLNTGDAFPEVRETVDKVREMVPHFVEIDGNGGQVIRDYGLPTDLLPYSSTLAAHLLGVATTQPMQDRFLCCSRTIMMPMGKRMDADGVTLIIRGQRNDETFKGQLRSGDHYDGIEYFYPIEDWTEVDVFNFIQARGWEVPRYYKEGMLHSGDCLTCTAWLGEGRGAYIKEFHPERFDEYRGKLAIVAGAAQASVNHLVDEVNYVMQSIETKEI